MTKARRRLTIARLRAEAALLDKHGPSPNACERDGYRLLRVVLPDGTVGFKLTGEAG